MVGAKYLEAIPTLCKQVREARGWSRERLARRLKVSAAVIYNIETGKSRTKIGLFFRFLGVMDVNAAEIMAQSLFSVQSSQTWKTYFNLPDRDLSAAVFKDFRRRLKLTQAELAPKLGYASSSMIHHFEKGIRECSIEDFFILMALSGDNLRRFVLGVAQDPELAALFPEGNAAELKTWEEYWSHPFIPAMRQIIRTERFSRLKRLRPGYFCDALEITTQQEKLGLAILDRLKLIEWRHGKPSIDPSASIFVPHNISPQILQNLKSYWTNFAVQRFAKSKGENSLLSIDLLPFNKEMFRKVVEMTRGLQDQVHGFAHSDTDGFVCLGWIGAFIETPRT
ncbi:MAG: helix-turn-helix domain-containing protein [Oligoflexales bacterium]